MAVVAVQIFRQALQPSRLPPIETSIALRVVTNQHLAKGRFEGFDMRRKIFAVLEVELVLSALFRRARGRVAFLGCIAKNRGSELFVDQNAGLIFGHSRIDGGFESVVDDSLGGGDLGCLFGVNVPSHPNIFFWNEPR